MGVDILDGLTNLDTLTLRRVFNKRHVHQHNGGVITERYVKKVAEDRDLLGRVAPLSVEEFEAGARVLRTVIEKVLSLGRREWPQTDA